VPLAADGWRQSPIGIRAEMSRPIDELAGLQVKADAVDHDRGRVAEPPPVDVADVTRRVPAARRNRGGFVLDLVGAELRDSPAIIAIGRR
jgi:hypothetical protein